MTHNTPPGNTHAADIHRARSAVQRRRLLMVGVSALTLAFTAAAAIGLATVAAAQSTGCSGAAAVSHTSTDTGLIADCNALLAAKPALLGDSSTTLNWSTSLSMSAWHGVGLNDSSTRVAALWLGDYGLQGEIPTELGNLTSLKWLYLDSNMLSGSIPSGLGGLASLTILDLHSNELSGSIPSGLGNLASLKRLYLDSNMLSDSIPTEFGNLASLTELYLDSNQLSGSIPSEFGGLTSLTILDLHSNELSGSIPSELGDLASLTELYLDSNMLSGSIPSGLGNLASLTILGLHDNQLSGCIPRPLTDLLDGQGLGLSACNVAPVFPDAGTVEFRVKESAAPGTAIGDPLVASDDDGDDLTYSLGNVDAASFGIDADSGRLVTKAALDYETKLFYAVTVTATDPSGESAMKSVTVTVTDTDEPGGLQLSPTEPVAGEPLRADLADPDEPWTVLEWTWWRSADSSGPDGWVQIDGAASSSYQPAAGNPDDGDPDGGGHVGLWLQVRVTYRDVHNPADSADPNVAPFAVKTLEAVTVNPVAPPNNNNGGGAGGGSSSSGGGASGGSSGGGGGGGGDFDVGVASFVVANGWSAADVGVASVLAARTSGAVVVYTAGDELSEETRVLLREALPAEVVIVGGNAAVSRDVRTQVRAASADSGITRVSGVDRADTAAGTARRILGAPAAAGRVTLVVANGWSPPDIGAAAALAARSGRSAVIYTGADSLPAPSAAVLGDYEVARVILVGGTAAISQDTQNAIAGAASDASISRLTGDDRIDTAAQAARRVLGNPAAAPDGVTLVIANGWSAPDVGVAAALAAATENAAVAYTAQGELPDATAALIRDYRPTQVIIVGGRAAIANDVRAAITETAPDSADIRRITGHTRTDTAARAARRILANL